MIILNISILRVVVYKLSYWQKFCWVIPVKIDKSLEIYFYFTILTFHLNIDIKEKISRNLVFDYKIWLSKNQNFEVNNNP